MSRGAVAIVGAGFAGLKCALELQQKGIPYAIYEASDGVGGRARTDELEGFRLDRGFQVLLTAYPEAQKSFSYESLRLGSFVPGAMVRMRGIFAEFADPLRRPRSAIGAASSPIGTFADKLRLFRMRSELVAADPQALMRRPETTTLEALVDRGFSTSMIEGFFRPFFGGVFIDPDLVTSSRIMEIFMRCFSTGDTALPAGGMGRLAEQLASDLDAGSIHLNHAVRKVETDGLVLDDGSRVDAEAVVVAVDESSASGLCGLPAPQGQGRVTTCLYFDAPESAVAGPWLVLSPGNGGPINELAVPSSVASGYAPPGRSLVSVSTLETDDEASLLESVKFELAEWFGAEAVSIWRHLRSYRVEHALPSFEPGRSRPTGEDPRLESGLFICGDHRETPSIQGALVSGRKAARAVGRQLAASA